MESDGTKTENFFHIRIHKNPRTERYLTFVKERFSEFIVCHEPQDEDVSRDHIHIHGQAYLKFKTEKQLRTEFKRWFPSPMIDGNADYTLKGPDNKIAPNVFGYKYVCKGLKDDWDTGKPEILATTFNPEQIQEFHRQYWNHQNRIIADYNPVGVVDSGEKLNGVKVKKDYRNWTRKKIDEWNELYEHDVPYSGSDQQRLVLTKFILKNLGDAGKALDSTIFMRIFNAFVNGIKNKSNEFEEAHINYYYDLTS